MTKLAEHAPTLPIRGVDTAENGQTSESLEMISSSDFILSILSTVIAKQLYLEGGQLAASYETRLQEQQFEEQERAGCANAAEVDPQLARLRIVLIFA
jgi:hypothetical protein